MHLHVFNIIGEPFTDSYQSRITSQVALAFSVVSVSDEKGMSDGA